MNTSNLPELPDGGIRMPVVFQELEAHLIAQALARTKGSPSRAARLLGIQRTTLITKMRKLGYQLKPSPFPKRLTT